MLTLFYLPVINSNSVLFSNTYLRSRDPHLKPRSRVLLNVLCVYLYCVRNSKQHNSMKEIDSELRK